MTKLILGSVASCYLTGCVLCLCVVASTPAKSNSVKFQMSWLPPMQKSQSTTLSYIKKKAGSAVTAPTISGSNLLAQLNARYIEARLLSGKEKQNTKRLYVFMGESLLLSQNMLSSATIAEQRRGLRVALTTTRRVSVSLNDNELRAQIFDGWLLPYLNVAANESWKDLSRSELLKAAMRAYAANDEKVKQAQTLRVLINIAEDANTRDQSRLQLAELLSGLGRHGEAAKTASAITSLDEKNIDNYITKLKVKEDAKKKALQQKKLDAKS